jgi:hypothetical protein
MEKIVIDLEAKTDKALKEIDKLKKELSNTNKEVKEVDKSTSEMSNSLDKATGGAITKFKGLKGALKTAVTGFKSLRVAIIGTGIGALLIAVTSLGQAFTRSEEGQNKFAKILGIIGSVTGNLLDLLADLGEGIISVFENPKQALIDFKNLLVENITNRFNAIIDTVGFLGSAIKKVFSGDFTGALEDAKSAGSSYVDSLTGVKNTLDKVTESTKSFVKELKEEAIIAGQIADQRAKADKVERKLIVERAKANRDRADLLEKSVNREKFTIQERIGFLREAGELEQEITNKEIAAARLRLEAKQAENALGKSTKEDLDEEANLKARLIDLETQRLTKQKEVTSQIIALGNEEKARLKAIEDEELAKQKETDDEEIEKAKALADLKKQIRDAEAVTEEERRLLEIEKTTEHYDNLIALAKANGLATVDLETAKTNALVKLAKVEEKANEKRVEGTTKALNQLTSVLGENTAIGKGMAIAAATINTYQGVTDALAAKTVTPFDTALKFINAAAILSNGLKTVKQIASVKIPAGRGGSARGGGSSSPAGGSISQPPAFNVVGASGTNQLAEAIGNQSQEPVKAYVVANDVSTAQSMDRNIVEGASI